MIKNNLKALVSHLIIGGLVTFILFILDKASSLPMIGSVAESYVNSVVSVLGCIVLVWYVLRGLRLKNVDPACNQLFEVGKNMLSVIAVSLVILTINLLGNVIHTSAFKFIETVVNAPLFVMAKSSDPGVTHMPYWFSFMPSFFISMGLLMKYGVKRAMYASIKVKMLRQGAES